MGSVDPALQEITREEILSLQEISDLTLADREALTSAVKSLERPSLAARLTNLSGPTMLCKAPICGRRNKG
jgi:hypothetical protein